MAPFTFALLAILTASLASAGPIAIDNSTLLFNGQESLVLNCQFQTLQTTDPCNSGETACIQGETATCVNGTWQTVPCPSNKACFALPSVRSTGAFVACTSPNNAAAIINATGIPADLGNNCSALAGAAFPFPTLNNTTPGDSGQNTTQGGGVGGNPDSGSSSSSSTTTQPAVTLPPTTTTLSPEQASPLISLLSLNSPSSVPSSSPSGVQNLGGNTGDAPPIITLTSAPVSPSTPTPTPILLSAAVSPSGGYSY